MASSSASATPTTGLYEPLQPPAYRITDNDKGGYAVLAAVVMVVICGLTICVKLQITYSTFRKFRRDDLALVAALVSALGHTIAICGAVDYGLGRKSSSQVPLLSQYYYASNIFLFLSLTSSKCSVALLVAAIQPNKRIVAVIYGLIAFIIAWGVAAVFLVALQCSPNRWTLGPTDNDTCLDQLTLQIAVRAVDLLTDIVLAISPAFMMMKVQMSMDKRLVVALMFGLRLMTPVFTAISLVSLANFYNKPTADRPFAAVDPSIWASITINISLITACLPSIKRFLTDWAAGVTNAPMLDAFELQNSSNNPTYGQSSGLRSFVRSQPRNKRGSKLDRSQLDQSRAEREDHISRECDTESSRGLTAGIVQTVDYRVEYEDEGHRSDDRTSS